MKKNSVFKRMDYTEMDARFSNAHAIKYEEFLSSSITYDEIRPFLDKLPPREIDLIELYYNEGKNQKDIAKIFGVTQGAISSRLSRAKERLRFLRELPKISEEDVIKTLSHYFDSLNIEIIIYMMRTTCQSKTAQIINEKYNLKDKKKMTQVKIRHRFEKCLTLLEFMKEKNKNLENYYKLLNCIKNNLYLLHEVKLPHFDRGNCAVFSMVI